MCIQVKVFSNYYFMWLLHRSDIHNLFFLVIIKGASFNVLSMPFMLTPSFLVQKVSLLGKFINEKFVLIRGG